jgi:hypothetical protein
VRNAVLQPLHLHQRSNRTASFLGVLVTFTATLLHTGHFSRFMGTTCFCGRLVASCVILLASLL